MTQTILNGGIYSQIKVYVGVPRELIVDDSNQELHLLDGKTPGGVTFQSRDSADQRYQKGSSELNALTQFKPTDKGLLTRLAPGNYVFRSIQLGSDALTISNGDSINGNPTIDLASTIPGQRTFAEDTTFQKRVIAKELDGTLIGDSTGSHSGNVDVRGKTLQLDDDQIPQSAIEGLQDVFDEITADLNSLIMPAGMIMMWGGQIKNIPKGWALCDGSQGTPNLSSCFVLGATTDATTNKTGGSANHTHVVTSETAGAHAHGIHVGDTTLTLDQIPTHYHNNGVCNDSGDAVFNHGSVGANPYSARNVDANNGAGTYEGKTAMAGGGTSHTHSGASDPNGDHVHAIDVGAGSNIPPYYTLAYVMKLA